MAAGAGRTATRTPARSRRIEPDADGRASSIRGGRDIERADSGALSPACRRRFGRDDWKGLVRRDDVGAAVSRRESGLATSAATGTMTQGVDNESL